MRLNYGRTMLLGLAFLGLQILFGVYNAYMPIFLQSGRPDFAEGRAVAGGFGLGAGATGLIMSLENLAAILILPLIGALSDNTANRLGRRKPWLLGGAPLTAASFVALPLLLGQPLWLFMLVALVFILAVDIIRTPMIALMPDITPSPLRSQANGVINMMGGVGGVLAFLAGGALFRVSAAAPFFFGGAALLVACLLVVVLVPVPSTRDLPRPAGGLRAQLGAALSGGDESVIAALRTIARDSDRSTALLLGAIFCLFLTYGALTVFFTSFASDSLGVARGEEGQLLTFFALAIVVFALPGGLLGARLGRRRVMLLGGAVFGLALALIGVSSNLALIRVTLVVAGAGWALIAVNALPMVLDCAPSGRTERIGVYTGIYFIATQTADVVGPTLIGSLIDLGGRDYRLMFVYVLVALLVALALLTRVRRGEAAVAAGA